MSRHLPQPVLLQFSTVPLAGLGIHAYIVESRSGGAFLVSHNTHTFCMHQRTNFLRQPLRLAIASVLLPARLSQGSVTKRRFPSVVVHSRGTRKPVRLKKVDIESATLSIRAMSVL